MTCYFYDKGLCRSMDECSYQEFDEEYTVFCGEPQEVRP